MNALVEGGADVVELGVPFYRPDGRRPHHPARLRARARAGHESAQGSRPCRAFRATNPDTPVRLMGLRQSDRGHGPRPLRQRRARGRRRWCAGGELPARRVRELCRRRQGGRTRSIFLLAPTSSEQRFADVARAGSGYIYYVSLKGVTGSAKLDIDEVARRIRRSAPRSACRWAWASASVTPTRSASAR